MLKTGEKAPSFELPDATMEMVSLGRFKGKNKVVLFFYPHDSMPQCADEAINFSDREEDFLEQGAVLIGVSQDDVMCHAEFCEANGLNAKLLSDVDGEVCKRYGVLHEKNSDGFKRTCVDRVTYIIDRQGVVRYAIPASLHGKEHIAEVLKLVKELN